VIELSLTIRIAIVVVNVDCMQRDFAIIILWISSILLSEQHSLGLAGVVNTSMFVSQGQLGEGKNGQEEAQH
jgi:hypothetical protein